MTWSFGKAVGFISQTHELFELLIAGKKYHGRWHRLYACCLVTGVEASHSFSPIQLSDHVLHAIVLVLWLQTIKLHPTTQYVHWITETDSGEARRCTTRCIEHNHVFLLYFVRKLFEILFADLVLQDVKCGLPEGGVREHSYYCYRHALVVACHSVHTIDLSDLLQQRSILTLISHVNSFDNTERV